MWNPKVVVSHEYVVAETLQYRVFSANYHIQATRMTQIRCPSAFPMKTLSWWVKDSCVTGSTFSPYSWICHNLKWNTKPLTETCWEPLRPCHNLGCVCEYGWEWVCLACATCVLAIWVVSCSLDGMTHLWLHQPAQPLLSAWRAAKDLQ